MGFELFIFFLQYFEFHCINSRRRHVAVLLAYSKFPLYSWEEGGEGGGQATCSNLSPSYIPIHKWNVADLMYSWAEVTVEYLTISNQMTVFGPNI